MIAAVVRAYNEERWIGRCLQALSLQSRRLDEVIVVDNESTDRTREIALSFGVRLLDISRAEFSYGRALNLGFAATRAEVVLILSAHCIPVDELWAEFLSVHLEEGSDPKICGVYGRQEPLPETGDLDSRDLWTTFREERQIQTRDYFFHNANSAIRRADWEELPFDEEIHGVEDRAWAKGMLAAGRRVVYEPHARVYHHHGIHQGRNPARARRVVEAIRFLRNSP